MQFPPQPSARKRQNFSRKRQAILEVIRSTQIHPTADWIYQALKPRYPDLSLGTVYRNLTSFKEQGLILRVGTVNGQERFDGNTTPHAHFICSCCGAVIDIMQDFTSTIASEQVQREYGCQVERQDVVFYGECAVCKAGKSGLQ